MGKAALIAFFCVKPDHRAAQNGSVSDHLTIADGAWAYCARDARLGEHVWEPTGGISVNEVESFARSRDLSDLRDARNAREGAGDAGAEHPAPGALPAKA